MIYTESNNQKYIISHLSTLKDALIALNNLSGDTLTLFVVNDKNALLGTLTDGDLRRTLITGVELDALVTECMNTNFSFIEENFIDVKKIKQFKQSGIKLLPIINTNFEIVRIINLQTGKSLLPIDAVLMAGGKGTGLRPLTETLPKPLLPVGKTPLIDYNIQNLAAYGVRNVYVTVNYLAHKIEAHFENSNLETKVTCVKEPDFLGTIGSVKLINSFENDTVLVMNSDLFTNIDFEEFYLNFIESNAEMSVAAVPYSIDVPYGIFELEDSVIKGIVEKPSYHYYANAGIYLIKKEILQLIPQNQAFDATDLIELLINSNKKVVRFPLAGYWIDIGKPAEYQKAQEFAKHMNF